MSEYDGPSLGDPYSDYALPEVCAGCGVQCELLSTLEGVHEERRGLIEAIGGTMDGTDAGAINTGVPSAQVEVARFARGNRLQRLSRALEEADAEAEEIIVDIENNARTCHGVLEVIAQSGDTTYTISLCTSENVHDTNSGMPSHLPLHIVSTKPEETA